MKLKTTYLALAMIAGMGLALGACGGSSDSPAMSADDAMMTPDPVIAERKAISDALIAAENAVAAVDDDATDAEVSAADMAIAKARSAIADAGNVPMTEKDADTRTVNVLANRLTTAKTSRTAAMNTKADEAQAALNVMAKKLRAGLSPEAAPTVTGVSVARGELTGTFDVDGSGGIAPESRTLGSSGAVAPSIVGWQGADYIDTKDGETHHARAYTNPGPPATALFSAEYGNSPLTTLTSNLVASSRFTATAGAEVVGKVPAQPPGATNTPALEVRGTYDGASGTYRCSGTAGTSCTATRSGSGYTLGGGTWTFTADAGAVVSRPDGSFLRFGWWARDDGKAARVATFVSEVRPDGSAALLSGDINALEGEARYQGGATGKVAIYSALDDDGNEAGVFTAAATLEAKFGTATAPGEISGTLNSFSVDGRDKDWSVSLTKAAIANGASTFGGPTIRTEWVIGGKKATAAGSWSGAFYETDAVSGVPNTAAGQFTSEYGNVGRMIGAFGANKQ